MGATQSIAVVGASLAGLRAVEALRRRGYDGAITWIGAEPEAPYDRPPLSKQLLDGTWQADRLFFRQKEGFDSLDVDRRFGRRATAVDPRARLLLLDDGESVHYDGLVVATGARPLTLRGSEGLSNVRCLRTLGDALAIAERLARSPRVAIAGAGFIGLEVAAACRRRGLDVTVVDPVAPPLVRVLGEKAARAIEQMHRDEGVRFELGRSVARFEVSGAEAEGLVLDDGRRIPAELVVVGIGVRPETGFLAGSGVAVDDGVVCDTKCASSVPGIVAAGDVARFENTLFGVSMRIEHWTNAVEQALAAVDTLLDGEGAKAFSPAPYFWSDQFGAKIQFAGHFDPGDRIHVVENDLRERRLRLVYSRKGRLTAALAINRPAALARYRRLVAESAPLDAALSP